MSRYMICLNRELLRYKQYIILSLCRVFLYSFTSKQISVDVESTTSIAISEEVFLVNSAQIAPIYFLVMEHVHQVKFWQLCHTVKTQIYD